MSSEVRRRRLYQATDQSSTIDGDIPDNSATETKPTGPEQGSGKSHFAVQSKKIIKRWCGFSAIYGIIPIPGVELAAVSTTQLLMLREIANAYGVKFSWHKGSVLITALLGGLTSGTSMIVLTRLLFPVVSVVSLAGLNASITYVLGRAFSTHFSEGGTLDDFDIKSVRRELTGYIRTRRTHSKRVS